MARSVLEHHKVEALRAYIASRSVGFIWPRGCGSGTLVQVAEDVLVATAGHVVRELIDCTDSACMLPVSAAAGPASQHALCSIRGFLQGCKYSTLPEADVGLIVLTKPVAEALRGNSATLDQLLDDQSHDLLQQHQQVAGFPYYWDDRNPEEDPPLWVAVTTQVHAACPYSHESEESGGVVVSHGLHVDWSGHWSRDGLPRANWRAGGMSGGPLWTVRRSVDGDIWCPERQAVLAGILFREDFKDGGERRPSCLRAEPIREWITLVNGIGNDRWCEAVSDTLRRIEGGSPA